MIFWLQRIELLLVHLHITTIVTWCHILSFAIKSLSDNYNLKVILNLVNDFQIPYSDNN
jgi:hypothetical protein